ncbi:MAG: radical SAM protein [Bacteriovoracales bacterium]|nr:radical SAM protein [Bacteriovoracales bacterium]
MKVLFLNPPFHNRFSRESRSPAVTKSDTLYYPKWLAHAAGVALKEGHDVDFIDAPAWQVDRKYVLDRMRTKGIKAVICDTSTPSIHNDIEVIDYLMENEPSTHAILVGRHVSSLAEQTIKKAKHLKAVAVREYEYTVRDWLMAVESGTDMKDVLGLVWRDEKGNVTRNPDRPAIDNLDELPFVSEVYKRFLRIEDYFYGHSKYPLVVFDTSRGCPYKCTFCVYPQTFSGHKMRYRSVDHVADEFDYVAREFPQCKTIMLEDDTFIIHKKRTEELADELIRRKNKIPFDSNCRADVRADVNFFKKLKQAGARLFCVGFESGDNDVLKHMKKNLNLTTAETFMKNCKEANIMVHGCFMVGNLNETRQTLDQTLELALKLNPDTAQFFPIMVYPGTAAYDEAKSRGLLSTENYDAWLTKDGLHSSVVNLPNMSHRDLVEFCDKARRKFYLRPSYMAKKGLQSLRDFHEFKRNLKGFKKLSKHLFAGSFNS